jgi:hypothetical protein
MLKNQHTKKKEKKEKKKKKRVHVVQVNCTVHYFLSEQCNSLTLFTWTVYTCTLFMFAALLIE